MGYTGKLTPAFIAKELEFYAKADRTHDPKQYVGFGKHGGLRWEALPDAYLDWLITKYYKSFNALKEIERRMKQEQNQ
jgi:hypothetical protein